VSMLLQTCTWPELRRGGEAPTCSVRAGRLRCVAWLDRSQVQAKARIAPLQKSSSQSAIRRRSDRSPSLTVSKRSSGLWGGRSGVMTLPQYNCRRGRGFFVSALVWRCAHTSARRGMHPGPASILTTAPHTDISVHAGVTARRSSANVLPAAMRGSCLSSRNADWRSHYAAPVLLATVSTCFEIEPSRTRDR
jgi:hypothetical protein